MCGAKKFKRSSCCNEGNMMLNQRRIIMPVCKKDVEQLFTEKENETGPLRLFLNEVENLCGKGVRQSLSGKF